MVGGEEMVGGSRRWWVGVGDGGWGGGDGG